MANGSLRTLQLLLAHFPISKLNWELFNISHLRTDVEIALEWTEL